MTRFVCAGDTALDRQGPILVYGQLDVAGAAARGGGLQTLR